GRQCCDHFGRVVCNAHRAPDIAQCVFGDNLAARLAKNQPKRQFVIWMTQQVVYRGQVEIHLARIFRFEPGRLEIHDDVASELQVIEQQIDVEVLAIHHEMHLLPHESETRAELDEKFADVCEEPLFQLSLGNRLTKREEIEVVWIAQYLFRKIGLRWWQ